SMLAHLPPAQVRALFPGRFVSRTGRGPASLRELRRVLAEDARRGWAVEDGHVTEGCASIAACAFDHTAGPAAAFTVTFRRADRPPRTWPALADPVRAAAAALAGRLARRARGRAGRAAGVRTRTADTALPAPVAGELGAWAAWREPIWKPWCGRTGRVRTSRCSPRPAVRGRQSRPAEPPGRTRCPGRSPP